MSVPRVVASHPSPTAGYPTAYVPEQLGADLWGTAAAGRSSAPSLRADGAFAVTAPSLELERPLLYGARV